MNNAKMYSIAIILIMLFSGSVYAQDQARIRICSYSVLNFDNPTQERIAALRTVIRAVQPDVLVLQDVVGSHGAGVFKEEILDYVGHYTIVGDADGPGNDSELYYDTTKISQMSFPR